VKLLRRDAPFSLPIKFIQFGEGNFLRAYVDWMIDLLNERVGLNAGVVVVRPRGHTVKPLLDVQEGLFTTLIQGPNEHGEAVKEYRKITCVQREINARTELLRAIRPRARPPSKPNSVTAINSWSRPNFTTRWSLRDRLGWLTN
jgi:tagaturonate reductase